MNSIFLLRPTVTARGSTSADGVRALKLFLEGLLADWALMDLTRVGEVSGVEGRAVSSDADLSWGVEISGLLSSVSITNLEKRLTLLGVPLFSASFTSDII